MAYDVGDLNLTMFGGDVKQIQAEWMRRSGIGGKPGTSYFGQWYKDQQRQQAAGMGVYGAPTPTAPTAADTDAAVMAERRKRRSGYASTILTGGAGLAAPVEIRRKTLSSGFGAAGAMSRQALLGGM